jgi:hypothetical protein
MARLAQDHRPTGAASGDTAAPRSLDMVTSQTSLGYPHNLRMLLQLPEWFCQNSRHEGDYSHGFIRGLLALVRRLASPRASIFIEAL